MNIRGAAPLRFQRLFNRGLRGADVFNNRRQDFRGVVAQFRLRHLRGRRHQRFGKDGEFADDCFVVLADERAQGHAVFR